ncbi:MAG TPA: nucleotidyl transferase AbiEii/AbiGii toxin family protein [Solirubrobacteraceae bacterium]|nr:nucleotidyl transferase AbiEii/AbiGii toxin family protein [Solirubrobacteraceae bacterium]
MIAYDYITQWGLGAPWPARRQIEQDLILSRLILEIAGDPLLGGELAFRGGTCLHKLHLPTALRYSEDLDYVRGTRGAIGPYIDALREITVRVGLIEKSRELTGQMTHFICTAPTEDGGEIRVKIEINIAETESSLPRITRPYAVDSRWWSGQADVNTFQIEELMSTKLRALYQRRKGRDLFDLWHALTDLHLDEQLVIDGLAHYMGDEIFTYRELAANLAAKLEHPDFITDLNTLTVEDPGGYDILAAADLVMERLGARLKNAPSSAEIANGAWRE